MSFFTIICYIISPPGLYFFDISHSCCTLLLIAIIANSILLLLCMCEWLCLLKLWFLYTANVHFNLFLFIFYCFAYQVSLVVPQCAWIEWSLMGSWIEKMSLLVLALPVFFANWSQKYSSAVMAFLHVLSFL